MCPFNTSEDVKGLAKLFGKDIKDMKNDKTVIEIGVADMKDIKKKCVEKPTRDCPENYNDCTTYSTKCPYMKCVYNPIVDCPKDYYKCHIHDSDNKCKYKDVNKEKAKEEEDKKKDKKLIINKKKIKHTKAGKLDMIVYPEIFVEGEEKVEEKTVEIDASKALDVGFDCGGHIIHKLKDLDHIKDWKFDGQNSECVYEEILEEVYGNIENFIELIAGNGSRGEHLKKIMRKSIMKAVKKKSCSFRKLEDIISGHNDITKDEKEYLMEEIIAEVNDAINDQFNVIDPEKAKAYDETIKGLEENIGEPLSDEEMEVLRQKYNGDRYEPHNEGEEESLNEEESMTREEWIKRKERDEKRKAQEIMYDDEDNGEMYEG